MVCVCAPFILREPLRLERLPPHIKPLLLRCEPAIAVPPPLDEMPPPLHEGVMLGLALAHGVSYLLPRLLGELQDAACTPTPPSPLHPTTTNIPNHLLGIVYGHGGTGMGNAYSNVPQMEMQIAH
jgi:hypothetical protein